MLEEIASFGKYFEVGFLLSICLVALYWHNHRSQIVFEDVAKILGSAQLIVVGVSICVEVVFNLACCSRGPERSYLFIGALAVIWNLTKGLKNVISKSKPQ